MAGVLPHVILGGDLNCLPETGAVQVLVKLECDMPDLEEFGDLLNAIRFRLNHFVAHVFSGWNRDR